MDWFYDEILKIILFVIYVGIIGFSTMIAMRKLSIINWIKIVELDNKYYNRLKWVLYALLYSINVTIVFLGIQSTYNTPYNLFILYVRYIIYFWIFLIIIEGYFLMAKTFHWYPLELDKNQKNKITRQIKNKENISQK